MLTRHISRRLAAYIDGQLAHRPARQAELHIGQCARCRAEYEQVKVGMATLESLHLVEAPEAIWLSIVKAQPRRAPAVRFWRFAVAAAILLAAIATIYWRLEHRWEVASVDAKGAKHLSRIAAGEWIETDSGSRATVKVGEIGSVEIAPNTRVRVLTARPDEHRLALARGEILAKITAPPRLFFVNTASGVAVDLGCEYTLNTNEDGLGLLRVTKGWVSFQWKGVESLVPAGASCRIRPLVGPGIPYFDDAPPSLQQGVSLSLILADARVRDTLTLWHLLSRVEPQDRARVYDRIAALTPVPAGVSRERALQLDPETLNRWKDELAWTW
jgi:FecR protein/Putative zinc-finger